MIDFCLSQLKVCDILMKSLNSSITQHVPAQLRPGLLGLKSVYPDQQAQVYEPLVFSQEAHGEQSASAAKHSFKSINNKRPITSQVNMSHYQKVWKLHLLLFSNNFLVIITRTFYVYSVYCVRSAIL